MLLILSYFWYHPICLQYARQKYVNLLSSNKVMATYPPLYYVLGLYPEGWKIASRNAAITHYSITKRLDIHRLIFFDRHSPRSQILFSSRYWPSFEGWKCWQLWNSGVICLHFPFQIRSTIKYNKLNKIYAVIRHSWKLISLLFSNGSKWADLDCYSFLCWFASHCPLKLIRCRGGRR